MNDTLRVRERAAVMRAYSPAYQLEFAVVFSILLTFSIYLLVFST